MPISVTSISPSVGRPAGWEYVEIEGSGFDQNPFPPPISHVGDIAPPVRVFFGSLEASDVEVYSAGGSSFIRCRTPRYVDGKDFPVDVDVRIENVLNPETHTEVDGFTYQKVNVTSANNGNFILGRIIDTLRDEIDRQTTVKVVAHRTHTDFDSDPSDGLELIDEADIPAIHLGFPSIVLGSSVHLEKDFVEDVGGRKFNQRPTRPRDLIFPISIYDESSSRLMANMQILHRFPEEWGVLYVEKLPGDASHGYAEYDMDWERGMSSSEDSSFGNLLIASGELRIRGVYIDRINGMVWRETFAIGSDGVTVL